MNGHSAAQTRGSARLRDAIRLVTALITALGTGCYATAWKPLPPKLPDRRIIELRTATDTLSLWSPQLEGDSIVAGQTLPHGVGVEGARTEDWTYVRIPVEGTLYKEEDLRKTPTVLFAITSTAVILLAVAVSIAWSDFGW